MKNISCFIAPASAEETALTRQSVQENTYVKAVYQLGKDLPHSSFFQTETLQAIVQKTDTEYLLLYMHSSALQLGFKALERMLTVANDSQAACLYTDSYRRVNGEKQPYPLLEYQAGSLRDDFDFGSLLLLRTSALRQVLEQSTAHYQFAGWYAARLSLSKHYPIVHLPEYLYTLTELDTRKTGEKQFDYVNPKQREVQIEMEQACTQFLKETGAYLCPPFEKINLHREAFDIEASVIIPVRNREKTIAEAIQSALQQQTSFPFTVIVVNNHSTDATGSIIDQLAATDSRLLHLIPHRDDLGIGGCWNWAVCHPRCGKFAVQLDSDDLYNTSSVLQTIVDTFYQEQSAMVIGSYQMVNFQLQEIPPGLIDHREWTPENGPNNALRINGLGAPRAFYTPILRETLLPNTSYGEDYAVGLALSRKYAIARIYQPLYWCRRWEGNTDSNLDVAAVNKNNWYKDKIRTLEYQARIAWNQSAYKNK